MSLVETLFEILDKSILALRSDTDISYLEGLVEISENLFQGEVLQDGLYTSTYERLKREMDKFQKLSPTKEEARRAFQLALLKGMKEGITSNHEMTPDAVAMFVGYLVRRFTEKQTIHTVLDLVVGTGNLLTAVLNELGENVHGIGLDADDLLVQLAYSNANFQQNHVELFYKDSLRSLLIDPVDVVVSDLPIGYYPNAEVAKDYELNTKEDMPFVHHLLMEQAVKYSKENSYLFFLIPNHLFNTEEGKQLHSFIQRTCHIQGLLQLPETMFKKKELTKSIFILQKKGSLAKTPKQILLAELPSFSNKQAMEKIVIQLEKWFTKEL